jgi:hypothetical protein
MPPESFDRRKFIAGAVGIALGSELAEACRNENNKEEEEKIIPPAPPIDNEDEANNEKPIEKLRTKEIAVIENGWFGRETKSLIKAVSIENARRLCPKQEIRNEEEKNAALWAVIAEELEKCNWEKDLDTMKKNAQEYETIATKIQSKLEIQIPIEIVLGIILHESEGHKQNPMGIGSGAGKNDPETNISIGMNALADHYKKTGQWSLAEMIYTGGSLYGIDKLMNFLGQDPNKKLTPNDYKKYGINIATLAAYEKLFPDINIKGAINYPLEVAVGGMRVKQTLKKQTKAK